MTSSTAKLFSGRDLDVTQRITAALVLYIVRMGVDARLIGLASEAGPNEVRFINPDEARELRVTYEPFGYKPWQVEPYKGGAIAVTESNDKLRRIVAACTAKLGPYVAIVDNSKDADEEWLNQCRQGMMGGEPNAVFGTRVDANRIKVFRNGDGGVVMRFQLPTSHPPLTSSALLSFSNGYMMACSTNTYLGSTENFISAVRLAFRNCH